MKSLILRFNGLIILASLLVFSEFSLVAASKKSSSLGTTPSVKNVPPPPPPPPSIKKVSPLPKPTSFASTGSKPLSKAKPYSPTSSSFKSSTTTDLSSTVKSSSGPFSTKVVAKSISVNHAHAQSDFDQKVKKMWQKISGNNSSSAIEVNTSTSSVYVKGEEQHVIDLENYIESLDKPITQVRIDAIILLATRNYNFDIGIDWSGIYNRAQSVIDSGSSFGFVGTGGNLVDFPKPDVAVGKVIPTNIGSTTVSGTSPNNNLFVNPANFALNLFNKVLSPTSGDSAGNSFMKIPFVFGGADLSLRRLNLVLNAAESEQKVKIVSRPSVLTGSGQQAVVKIGTQLPMQSSTTGGSSSGVLYKGNSVTYKPVGISLTVTPTIGANNDSVTLDIDLADIQVTSGSTNSNDDGIMTNPPVLSDLSVTNKVLLKNGQTTVIGGLAKKTDKKTKNKMPILHKIPLLGNLFKASFTTDSELEQFIFITPTIVETN